MAQIEISDSALETLKQHALEADMTEADYLGLVFKSSEANDDGDDRAIARSVEDENLSDADKVAVARMFEQLEEMKQKQNGTYRNPELWNSPHAMHRHQLKVESVSGDSVTATDVHTGAKYQLHGGSVFVQPGSYIDATLNYVLPEQLTNTNEACITAIREVKDKERIEFADSLAQAVFENAARKRKETFSKYNTFEEWATDQHEKYKEEQKSKWTEAEKEIAKRWGIE